MYYAHIFIKQGIGHGHVCTGEQCGEEEIAADIARQGPFDSREAAEREVIELECDYSHDPANCEACKEQASQGA